MTACVFNKQFLLISRIRAEGIRKALQELLQFLRALLCFVHLVNLCNLLNPSWGRQVFIEQSLSVTTM